MMLKVNGEFLDFNDFVEVEKRVKLFEKIDETLGDFSYAFSLDKTSKNLKILGFPFPDVKDKMIYQEVNCDLLDESGNTLYKGVLKVERVTKTIECSFFSGNYNWISQLSGLLTDLDLSDLQTELTASEIVNSADNTEGIIYPIIDTGALITRSFRSLMVEDFSGCIFVKTLMQRIFNSTSIKLEGDLFKDPVYNNLLLSKSTIGPEDINSLSSYVKLSATQSIGLAGLSSSDTKITFDDDTTSPFFDGDSDAFNTTLSRYVAPVKEKIIIEATIIQELTPGTLALLVDRYFEIYKNGVSVFKKRMLPFSTPQTDSFRHIVTLEIGDYVEAFIHMDNNQPAAVNLDIFENSTLRITPTFIYRTTGQSLVPNWTQGQFVSNLLSLFCCITDFEPVSKTLTIDFFEGIASKEPIDLSHHVSELQEDYSEFISSFGKRSLLKYQESDLDSVKQYNLSNVVGYGDGEIIVNNDYIENTADIVDSEFKAPISYINETFSASLERTEFVQIEDNGDAEFTGVTDNGGEAQFDGLDDSLYTVGELVRISEATNSAYNGDYVVKTVGSGLGWIILRGLYFATNATGKITKQIHRIGSDDGVYLLINTKYRVDNVSQYSGASRYYIEPNEYGNIAYAFFNMLATGRPINDSYKQGLSFGSIEHPLNYQRSLVDKYWPAVSRVLNDPVKIEAIGHIPKIVFNRITPLRPIRIKAEETNNLYYLNRIGGYKESYLPCEIDLIKLS